jgi:hypothetical protein
VARERKHPLSGAMYEVDEDGLLTITSRDGVSGRFTPNGDWVSGDLHQADPHLCGWLAGPRPVPNTNEVKG